MYKRFTLRPPPPPPPPPQFGLLTDANSDRNDEPGSFGAAWTLAAWVAGRRNGVKRAYHWGHIDYLKSNREDALLQGQAWLMAVAELAVGAPTTLALSSDELLPPQRRLASAALSPSSTAWGLVALGAKPGTVHVLLSFFDYLGYTTAAKEPTAVTLTVDVPLNRVGGRRLATGCRAVKEYRLSSENAVYDQMYRDLAYINALSLTDGRTHPLHDMATPAGVAYVEDHADTYMAMQRSALQPSNFSGLVNNDGAHERGSVAVHIPMQLQSVAVVELQCS